MHFQFIDITSFRHVSSEAEHFYAKVGKPELTQENYLFLVECEVNSGVSFANEEDLRYYPTENEALKMWEKDNRGQQDAKTWKDNAVKDYMEKGTIRFPSVLSIIEAARKKFPNSIICFSMFGSRKQFAKYLFLLEKSDKETFEKIVKTILPD